jgi:hypothetical protein
MIPSLWLPVARFLTEILAHASQLIVTKAIDRVFREHKALDPIPLLKLRAHFSALKDATDALAKETHAGALSECYAGLRAAWLERFAPAQTVLHNFDPLTISTLGIYSPRLAALLSQPLLVSEKTLTEALRAEQTELSYDTDSHLCTLCLQMVRTWSSKNTIVGGLNDLSGTLTDTIANLDSFIKSNWAPKELARLAQE